MSARGRLAVLATCCLSLLLVTMDATIVNVALPAIRRDLHASMSGMQWAVDGYTIVVASLLLFSGALADRVGRRRTFQLGLVVFGVGSLACSLAPTTGALVAARMLQAVGGSMLNPVAMSIVVSTFEDAAERARALGAWGAVFGVSMAAGPVLGGLLVDTIGWRAIFWVNVPVVVLALALAARFVPARDAARPTVVAARTVDGPRLAWATSLAALAFAAFSAFLFVDALYLQDVRGLSARAAGTTTLPIAVALAIASPLSGRLVAAGWAWLAVVIAGTSLAGGAFLLVGLSPETPLSLLALAYALFGVGIGTIGAPVNTAATSAMPGSRAGVASAIASTSRQTGAALGVALAGALPRDGTFWVVTALGVVIVALGLISRVGAVGGAIRLPPSRQLRHVLGPCSATTRVSSGSPGRSSPTPARSPASSRRW